MAKCKSCDKELAEGKACDVCVPKAFQAPDPAPKKSWAKVKK